MIDGILPRQFRNSFSRCAVCGRDEECDHHDQALRNPIAFFVHREVVHHLEPCTACRLLLCPFHRATHLCMPLRAAQRYAIINETAEEAE